MFSRPPEYFQVAPLLFRWAERLAFDAFGPSEYALRLPPLLAGCAALLIFAWIARSWLEPRAATLATGIFAVGYPLVRAATEVKPYATDGLAAVIVLWAALHWVRRARCVWRAALFAISAGGAVWLSFPTVLFVAGVGFGLMFFVRGRQWLLLIGAGVVVGASFAANVLLYAQAQMQRSAGSWLEDYWADGFPDIRSPAGFAWWLLRAHTCEMMGYPIGGTHFGGITPALLVLGGVVALARARHGRIATLLMMPFAASMVAAILHHYPYGVAPRLAQHLAPLICLLAGCGVAAAAAWFSSRRVGLAIVGGFTAILVVVAILGFTRDVLKPFKYEEDRAVRDLVQTLGRELPAGERIAILNPRETAEETHAAPQFLPTARYYLQTAGFELFWCEDETSPTSVRWIMALHGESQPPTPADVTTMSKQAGMSAVELRHWVELPIARKRLEVFACTP